MNTTHTLPSGSTAAPPRPLSAARFRLLAFCVGAVVANIYYAQPVVDAIARSFGLSIAAATNIVSLTQMGYALGLFLIVPLGDLLESRRLIVISVLASSAALAIAASSSTPGLFLAGCLLIGLSSVSVQVMVPLAAHYAPPAERGRVVGNIMSGLVAGILLARPLSSLVVDHFGWRAIFWTASALMLCVAVLIGRFVPSRQPRSAVGYDALIASLVRLLKETPVLRRRALYQASLFAAFSMFWTTIPIELVHKHGFSQSQVALFTLIGATGTLAGPFGGRLADAGRARFATLLSLGGAGLSLLALAAPSLTGSVLVIGLVAVAFDFCVQMNMVVGQRAIFQLAEEHRSRLNALYTTSIFIGGAVGSSVGGSLYATGGLGTAALAGGVLALLIGVLAFVIEPSRD
ncbi:MFS transporter [Paucibacter sp. R3-3]|uniref:MFS transporter n=1 Tax=Roseateles agri TaxID=3098619 RepID=A0ABU5DEF9_9BURK|nr:MFS transporter [Paucibacter sp. R3-3]MDY0744662.1 MFS transporter [Paucibacter sp. R3-3]